MTIFDIADLFFFVRVKELVLRQSASDSSP